MNNPTLGKLLTGGEQRDAIHVAIAPVQAQVDLLPGRHVDATGNVTGEHVGIVDPFLGNMVRKGDWFYLFLYPNTVTSLRHVWTHPAFPPEGPATQSSDVAYSERWLRDYARRAYNYDEPEDAFQRLIDGLRTGELYSRGSSDRYSINDYDDPDGLKEHAERYLGITIDWNRFTFRCSR